MSNSKVYELVTDRILAKLREGVVPWHQTWSGGSRGMWPQNVISRKPYRGVNVWLTLSAGFRSPFWLTFKQAQELGGHVRKGEHGTPIVYADRITRATVDAETGAEEFDSFWFLKYFTVFNVAQCEGLPFSETELLPEAESTPAFEPIAAAQRIINGMPKRPQIVHAQQAAFYRPAEDLVNLPQPETFESREAFYRTAFHELTHSTAHVSRVGRPLNGARFGSHDYGREELVAEMGSAYLTAVAGIDQATIELHAGYIDGWIRTIREDSKLVLWAASQAQKAADYILNATAAEERLAA